MFDSTQGKDSSPQVLLEDKCSLQKQSEGESLTSEMHLPESCLEKHADSKECAHGLEATSSDDVMVSNCLPRCSPIPLCSPQYDLMLNSPRSCGPPVVNSRKRKFPVGLSSESLCHSLDLAASLNKKSSCSDSTTTSSECPSQHELMLVHTPKALTSTLQSHDKLAATSFQEPPQIIQRPFEILPELSILKDEVVSASQPLTIASTNEYYGRPSSSYTNPSTSSLGLSPQLCSPSFRSSGGGKPLSQESCSLSSFTLAEEDMSPPKAVSKPHQLTLQEHSNPYFPSWRPASMYGPQAQNQAPPVATKPLEAACQTVPKAAPPHQPQPQAVSRSSKNVCFQCDKTFDTKVQLKNHESQHDPCHKFRCCYPNCDRSFKSQSYLQNHIRRLHKNNKSIICCHCDFQSPKKKEFDHHMLKFHKDCTVSCCVHGCPFRFHNEAELMRHIEVEHTAHEGPLQCVHCSQAFTNEAALAMHFQHCGQLQHRHHPQLKAAPSSSSRDPYDFSAKDADEEGSSLLDHDEQYASGRKLGATASSSCSTGATLSTLECILDDVVQGNINIKYPMGTLDSSEQSILEKTLSDTKCRKDALNSKNQSVTKLSTALNECSERKSANYPEPGAGCGMDFGLEGEDIFSIISEEQLAALENNGSEPQATASAALPNTATNHHLRSLSHLGDKFLGHDNAPREMEYGAGKMAPSVVASNRDMCQQPQLPSAYHQRGQNIMMIPPQYQRSFSYATPPSYANYNQNGQHAMFMRQSFYGNNAMMEMPVSSVPPHASIMYPGNYTASQQEYMYQQRQMRLAMSMQQQQQQKSRSSAYATYPYANGMEMMNDSWGVPTSNSHHQHQQHHHNAMMMQQQQRLTLTMQQQQQRSMSLPYYYTHDGAATSFPSEYNTPYNTMQYPQTTCTTTPTTGPQVSCGSSSKYVPHSNSTSSSGNNNMNSGQNINTALN